MKLTFKQQHDANRRIVSGLLPLPAMDRTEFRQKLRRDAFKRLRTRFLSNVEMADALGDAFSPSYVSQLLNGHRGIGDDVATKIEDRLGLAWGYLDRMQTDVNTEAGPDIAGRVPLISWVQAGAWSEIVDVFAPGDAEEWLPCPVTHSDKTFVLRVRGESMYNPHGRHSFQDGDLIFVDPERQAAHGSLVVVRMDEIKDATFKKLVIEGERKYLRALNPAWPEPMIEVNGQATICGVVIFKGERL